MFALCSCQIWVQTSGRDDSKRSQSVEYLSANCKLCADHFKDSQFMNAVTHSRLIWNAVPTVFAVPNLPKQLEPPLKQSSAELVKSAAKRRRDGMFTIRLQKLMINFVLSH